jgi:hypothetical protein
MLTLCELKEKKKALNYTRITKLKMSKDAHRKIIELEFNLQKEINTDNVLQLILLLKVIFI